MPPVHLAGPKLALREVEPEDTEALLAIYGDAEAIRHLSFEPRTFEQVQAIVDRSIASATDTPRTEYCLAITRRGEHQLIGYARLATEPQQAATIGLALHPAEWGRGLGTETVHLLCALGFRTLGLHAAESAWSGVRRAVGGPKLRAVFGLNGRRRPPLGGFSRADRAIRSSCFGMLAPTENRP